MYYCNFMGHFNLPVELHVSQLERALFFTEQLWGRNSCKFGLFCRKQDREERVLRYKRHLFQKGFCCCSFCKSYSHEVQLLSLGMWGIPRSRCVLVNPWGIAMGCFCLMLKDSFPWYGKCLRWAPKHRFGLTSFWWMWVIASLDCCMQK